MKRFFSILISLLLGLYAFFPFLSVGSAEVTYRLEAEIAVFGIDSEAYIRSCGMTAPLDGLGSGEYYTYCAMLYNTGDEPWNVGSLGVSVDGGEIWLWQGGTIEAGSSWRLHIYYSNMKTRMTEGQHTVTWYADGYELGTMSFTLTPTSPNDPSAPGRDSGRMNWEGVFPIPSADEIEQANREATVRSPYVAGGWGMSDDYRFTEYAVDFRADTLPKATYCCLANMQMDLSPLRAKYSNVRTEYEGVNMYAGFQRTWEETLSILSFWDIYYDDANGVTQTIRARRLYPDVISGADHFGGEGTGARALVPFAWEADHWYRMLLQSYTDETSGNTLVDQWVCDLETEQWTLLCRFDTGLQGSCFTGPCAFFLENFDDDYAGEVRTMEVANARVKDASTGQWVNLSSARLALSAHTPPYVGTYSYGAQGSRIWMITSGAGGNWVGTERAPQQGMWVNVQPTESGSPY